MVHKGANMVAENIMTVPKFFNQRFWEWQAGERRTQKEFAEYLGVGPGTLSHWMNGARTPDYNNCITLSSKLGPEIFDVVGYLRPDPELRALIRQWDNLSDAARRGILKDAGVEEYSIEQGRSKSKRIGLSVEQPDRTPKEKNKI